MPYEVMKDTDACPISRPWAVKKQGSGDVAGCHATEGDANEQMQALHANEPMMNSKPPRFCHRAVTFRAEPSADGFTLEGYAAVFNTPTRIDSWEGEFDEQISRGAFKRTLKARMPVLQFDHGTDARTGSVPIGAIQKIHEDDRGLFVRAKLFDNDVVKPIRQAIAGGAIDGMSFRFRVNDEQWTKRTDDIDLRTIREVELFELGPVVFPAYDATTVGVRSLIAQLDVGQAAKLIRSLATELDVKQDPEPAHQGTSDTTAEPVHMDTSRGTALAHARRRYKDKEFIDA